MRRWVPWLCFGGLALGCRTPTQITIEVTTDVKCSDAPQTTIAVGTLGPGFEGKPPVVVTPQCRADGRVGSLVIVPSGDRSAEVGIKVVTALKKQASECLADETGCIVARRSLRFVPHEELYVPIEMHVQCKGVKCGDYATCVGGNCVDATIGNSNQCARPEGCGEATLSPPTSAPDAGVDAPVDAAPPVPIAGLCPGDTCAPVTHVIAGSGFACARRDGLVKCWGSNAYGTIGQGTTGAPILLPQEVPGAAGAVQLTATERNAPKWGEHQDGGHVCARFADGTVKCWGGNADLQLGFKGSGASPTLVPDLRARSITVGFDFTCALLENATAKCWGWNAQHQLGDGLDGDQLPLPVLELDHVAQLAAWYSSVCALIVDGTLRCWGSNVEGELAMSGPAQPTPTRVPDFGGAIAITSTCALLASGKVACWGPNEYNQLGVVVAGAPYRGHPELVPGVDGAVQISSGDSHDCALLSSSKVMCWGDNEFGQLGVGHVSPNEPPTLVPGLDHVVEVSAGNDFTCAARDDGALFCWGLNKTGQLGDGTIVNQPSPTPVKW